MGQPIHSGFPIKKLLESEALRFHAGFEELGEPETLLRVRYLGDAKVWLVLAADTVLELPRPRGLPVHGQTGTAGWKDRGQPSRRRPPPVHPS